MKLFRKINIIFKKKRIKFFYLVNISFEKVQNSNAFRGEINDWNGKWNKYKQMN